MNKTILFLTITSISLFGAEKPSNSNVITFSVDGEKVQFLSRKSDDGSYNTTLEAKGQPVHIISTYNLNRYAGTIVETLYCTTRPKDTYDVRPVERCFREMIANTTSPWQRRRGSIGLAVGLAAGVTLVTMSPKIKVFRTPSVQPK